MLGRVSARCCVAMTLLVVLVLGQLVALPAQGEQELRRDESVYGRIVNFVHVLPASRRERVISRLKTKKDQKLTKAQVREDLATLYEFLKFRANVSATKIGDDRVDVFFEILPSNLFDHTEFLGNAHLSDQEAWGLTGLRENALVSEDDAERAVLLLRGRYRQDGYYFADIVKNVKTVEREGYIEKTLQLLVDEGPEVQIRSLRFRGNTFVAGSVPLGMGLNLQGDAGLEQVPGVVNGSPFSALKVEDDAEKIELFYRRKGFLNCKVHLEEMNFSKDKAFVDLCYRVHEGQRFTISAVDIEVRRSADPNEKAPARYSKELLMERLSLKQDDYYDAYVVTRDKRALEIFYGKRGHPTMSRYGFGQQQYGSLFQVSEPLLTFHETKPEVKVTYRLVEGEPKKLREVRIQGNTITRDRVIRRHVKLMPGDLLDVTKMDRSRYLLDRTGYFVDRSLSGVRLELKPVPGSEQDVDLDIVIQEGETGAFTWGAGVSSGTGARATIQFNKRNFDIQRLPSSWSPGTWFSELSDGKAFHGGGQTLDLLLAPGTEVSYFRLSWIEPDIFEEHMDTIGLRVDGYKTLRVLDSYNTHNLGTAVTFSRIFDETTKVSLTVRDEDVAVKSVDSNAPLLVWRNEGSTEIRALRLGLSLSDLDNPMHPREGYNFDVFGMFAGGPVGGGEDFYKFGVLGELYRPFLTDSFDRKHIVYSKFDVKYADTFGDSEDLFPSERFFMGGSNLRGFDQRHAGPTQFGEPIGGKAMLVSSLEYQFPLVSTQMQGTSHHTEIIRGVLFTDFGMLGLDMEDNTLSEPRLTVGFGLRIQVPLLQVPIQLDLGWPVLSQETDKEEQLYFSFRNF